MEQNNMQPEQRTIGDLVYTIYKLPPRVSVPVVTKLLKIISPLVSAAIKGGDDSEEDVNDINGSTVIDRFLDSEDVDIDKIVSAVFDRIDEDDVYDIIKKCFSATQFNGQNLAQIMEVHFMSKELHMFKVFYAVLEVQYGNFFAQKESDTLQEDLEVQGLKSSKKKQASTSTTG